MIKRLDKERPAEQRSLEQATSKDTQNVYRIANLVLPSLVQLFFQHYQLEYNYDVVTNPIIFEKNDKKLSAHFYKDVSIMELRDRINDPYFDKLKTKVPSSILPHKALTFEGSAEISLDESPGRKELAVILGKFQLAQYDKVNDRGSNIQTFSQFGLSSVYYSQKDVYLDDLQVLAEDFEQFVFRSQQGI